MALQQDYINGLNQTIPDCYWKLGVDDGFIGGKNGFECKLYCYETKTQADLNQDELFIYDFRLDLDLGVLENIMEQAYEELKENHPLFEDAIDI